MLENIFKPTPLNDIIETNQTVENNLIASEYATQDLLPLPFIIPHEIHCIIKKSPVYELNTN